VRVAALYARLCSTQVEFQPCGQVAGAIREIEPAHVVFNRMLLGARDQLDRMNRCRL